MLVPPLLLLAVLTGFGGLLFELVCVRRTALLLGWGSTGQGVVFGAFLLGLGVGAWVLPGLARLGRRPLRSACLLYAIVAVGLPLAYRVLDTALPGHAVAAVAVSWGVPFATSRIGWHWR